jgi:multiple sugar transport system substrate-binding protein
MVNGANYGVPYRLDPWLLFYNKDLFYHMGIADADGMWTWDIYVATAKELEARFVEAGIQAKGTYEHSWQSTVQGFANAQSGDNTNPSGSYFSGNYSYMLPYYQRALDLQDYGAQLPYSDITSQNLSYQTQFGKQSTAMMLMGSWYIATLISQQASGEADSFEWGLAPAPQVNSSTFDNPVTFGDPMGMGINATIDPAKLEAAKYFLAYIASEDAAKALAGIGVTSSLFSDAVTTAVFANPGMPTDNSSKTAYQVHLIKPENPSGAYARNISAILDTAHSAIMSGSEEANTCLGNLGMKVKNRDW